MGRSAAVPAAAGTVALAVADGDAEFTRAPGAAATAPLGGVLFAGADAPARCTAAASGSIAALAALAAVDSCRACRACSGRRRGRISMPVEDGSTAAPAALWVDGSMARRGGTAISGVGVDAVALGGRACVG